MSNSVSLYDHTEPDESSVPIPVQTRTATLDDVYSVLVDIHSIESQKLAIMQALGSLVNQASEQLPSIMEQIEQSPLFGMFNGGGGLLGGLFRR